MSNSDANKPKCYFETSRGDIILFNNISAVYTHKDCGTLSEVRIFLQAGHLPVTIPFLQVLRDDMDKFLTAYKTWLDK